MKTIGRSRLAGNHWGAEAVHAFRVEHVSADGGFAPVFDARFTEAGADGVGAPTTLEPGPVTVTASVSATYTAE